MRIYIASSWRNQHAVEMLTHVLRALGHQVVSWIENNFGENPNSSTNCQNKRVNFETWIQSPEADESFEFDTRGAYDCDLFIYLGAAGKDAAAECGICYARKMDGSIVTMFAVFSKGEDFGLMRKMFDKWFDRITDLLEAIESL